ncbi:MAG: hypothetical protein WCQ41_04085 [Bacillota bacterium]
MTSYTQTNKFIKVLKTYELSKQQFKTLKGQAAAGDIVGARKGLDKILKRMENHNNGNTKT